MAESDHNQAAQADVASQPTTVAPETMSEPKPPVHTLVLDAGPLLSLTPLRRMAERFVVPPQVVAELRDEKARIYWERIQAGLIEGVHVEVKTPDAISVGKGKSGCCSRPSTRAK